MISVCLPTRGLVFTEVEEALSNNFEGKYDYKIYRSFNLPIPDCQNELVEKALNDGATRIFFVEEDVVLPENTLNKLILADADIACLDYGVEGWSCVTRAKKDNEILWCGLGATLIKREVFDVLEKPYFRQDRLLLLNDWPEVKWVDAGEKERYGGQDIYFCCMARDKGFKIVQIPGEARHLKLDKLGQPGVNKGLHEISQKPPITKHQIL